MNYIYLLLFVLLISGCIKKQAEQTQRDPSKSGFVGFDSEIPFNPTKPDDNSNEKPDTDKPTELSKEEILQLATSEISADKIRTELNLVSSDQQNGRLPGTQGHDAVADYITSELTKVGIEPFFGGSYTQNFNINLSNVLTSTKNLVAVIPGTDPVLNKKAIVLGAHFDHTGSLSRGTTCRKNDQEFGLVSNNICNGADDNASGTTALLGIARALYKVKDRLKKTVVIAWFSAEEEGLLGSKFFVENPTRNDLDYEFMVNFDMVGNLRNNNQVLLANDLLDSNVVTNLVRALDAKYDAFRIQLPTSNVPFGRSDHSSFMVNGIPAVHFFTSLDASPYYHSTADSPERIDINGIQQVSEFSVEFIYDLATTVNIEPPQFIYDSVLKKNIKKPLMDKELASKACHDLLSSDKRKLFDFFQNGPSE